MPPLVLDGTNGVSGVDGTASNPAIEGTDSNTGIFYPAADTVAIGTGGTEALRVNSSQNVGIGTSSPGVNLQVEGAGASSIRATFKNTNSGTGECLITFADKDSTNNNHVRIGSTGNNLVFYAGNSDRMRLDSSGNLGLGVTPSVWSTAFGQKAFQFGPAGSLMSLQAATNNNQTFVSSNAVNLSGGWTYMYADLASQYRQYAGTHAWFTASSGTAGNPITFTQAMSLDNNGSFTVTTRALALVGNFISNVAGDVSQPAVFIQKYDNNSTTSQIFMRFVINNQGNACGQITANGANTAAFGTVSDKRLKDNIVDLPSQLDNILALRPVEFDYIESEGGGHQLGFIAQEVQEIYPDLVGEREDGMLTLTDMNKNDARLIKAFQELAAKVTALEAEIAALKGNA